MRKVARDFQWHFATLSKLRKYEMWTPVRNAEDPNNPVEWVQATVVGHLATIGGEISLQALGCVVLLPPTD